VTRYELFRKRIAPALFLGVVALIAYDTCDKAERTHATIVMDLGEAEARVRGIQAELVVENEVIGNFSRRAMPDMRIGCPCSFSTAMPSESGELRIEVDLGGEVRTITKKVHAIEGGKTTVSLERELR
jgi:hypothetical protein